MIIPRNDRRAWATEWERRRTPGDFFPLRDVAELIAPVIIPAKFEIQRVRTGDLQHLFTGQALIECSSGTGKRVKRRKHRSPEPRLSRIIDDAFDFVVSRYPEMLPYDSRECHSSAADNGCPEVTHQLSDDWLESPLEQTTTRDVQARNSRDKPGSFNLDYGHEVLGHAEGDANYS